MGVNNASNKKFNKDITEINIIYRIKYKECIRLFGYKFVENNKNICKMIIEDKEYELIEKYDIVNFNNNILEIKLKGINNIKDMSYMFFGCSSLSSLPDISKWNTNNITNMYGMFYGCLLLSSLPDISKWNTNNVTDMVRCLVDVHHYYHYLIFQNGILIMLLI